jgi:hypothetical protein
MTGKCFERAPTVEADRHWCGFLDALSEAARIGVHIVEANAQASEQPELVRSQLS